MYPIFYGQPPMYPNQPPTQGPKSIRETITELEELEEWMAKKKKSKEPEKPKTWRDKKYGILEIATCMIIVCFFGAIPVTTWMLSSIANLYHTMQTIFK
jgi:uncharacterized ion transporter superfamily protein YfcC